MEVRRTNIKVNCYFITEIIKTKRRKNMISNKESIAVSRSWSDVAWTDKLKNNNNKVAR